MMRNKKGQLTIIGIIVVFATIIVYAAIYPALKLVIDGFINTSGDPILNIVISLVPLLIMLGIIITLFMYVTPAR